MLSASKHVFGGTAPGGPQLWNASPDHYTGFSCLNMPGSVTIQALATCPYCHVVLTWIHCGLCWPSVAGWGGVCHDMPGFFHQGDGGRVLFVVASLASTMAHQGISWLIWSVATHQTLMQHILSLYVGFFHDTSRHAKIRGSDR